MKKLLALASLVLGSIAPAQTAEVAVPGALAPQVSSVVAPGHGATPVRKTPQVAELADVGVKVTAWSPWPDMLYQGYEPISIRVENASKEERTVQLELTRGYGDERTSVHAEVVVPAGGVEQRSLFAPVSRRSDSDYQVSVRCDGEGAYMTNVGAQQSPIASTWPMIYAHSPYREPAAGAAPSWSAALSSSPPPDVPAAMPENTLPALRRIAAVGGGAWPTPSPGFAVDVTPVAIEELPTRYEPYTSLKGVIVDAQSAVLPLPVLDAVAQYARLGGCVVFQGPDAEARARSVPAFAAWMEERFVLHEEGASRVYRCGQGTLGIAGADDMQEHATAPSGAEREKRWSQTLATINRAITHPVSFASSPHHDVALASAPRVGGLELPYRALTLLLVLFAIVIGPVNLIAVKKLNRPALLLVTVPLIALVFSLGLFAYGALAQGLGTRAAAMSLTWLDQRAHSASTLEVRSLFAGMPAGDGWKPGAGASCFVLPDETRPSGAGRLDLDFRGELVYGADYLPVRREARTSFLVDRAARGRLAVTKTASGVAVENGLGANVEQLVLRDADGGWFTLEGVLADGARRDLVPREQASEGVERVKLALGVASSVASDFELFPGGYVARVASSPFGDACGVEYEEEGSTHVVIGVLESTGAGR